MRSHAPAVDHRYLAGGPRPFKRQFFCKITAAAAYLIYDKALVGEGEKFPMYCIAQEVDRAGYFSSAAITAEDISSSQSWERNF